MTLALHLGSGADHSSKVTGLILDMIERLEDKAEANATVKVFCYEELCEQIQRRLRKRLKD